MSVAETTKTESITRNPQQQFAFSCFLGAVALLAGLWFVFAGLPELWWRGWESIFRDYPDVKNNQYLSEALLILLDLAVIGVLAFAAVIWLQKQTIPGLRAGIFFGALYLFFSLLICAWLGGVMEGQFKENPTVGWGVLAVVLGLLLAGAIYVYAVSPGWHYFLEAVEHQGWFHGYSYKGNQGVRVRRGTIMGILAIGFWGIITMVINRFFGFERPDAPNDWYWLVPYASTTTTVAYVPLMFKVHLIMPIVLGVLLFWFAWRVVNVPGFADFLVATEAEMNKVSWTSRRKLYQDTIVVLVTVFLFTTFLFVVDVLWIKILSAPGIQVLLIDTRAEAQKREEKAQW